MVLALPTLVLIEYKECRPTLLSSPITSPALLVHDQYFRKLPAHGISTKYNIYFCICERVVTKHFQLYILHTRRLKVHYTDPDHLISADWMEGSSPSNQGSAGAVLPGRATGKRRGSMGGEEAEALFTAGEKVSLL